MNDINRAGLDNRSSTFRNGVGTLDIQERILSIPARDDLVPPNQWSNQVMAFVASCVEESGPKGLPLLVDVMRAALQGDCCTKQDDV